jgi:uncharacterized protein YjiS (DUF1127 family)
MAHIETRRAAAHPADQLTSRVANAIISWRNRRATRKALAELSDRELDDIGIHRSDIDRVARRY